MLFYLERELSNQNVLAKKNYYFAKKWSGHGPGGPPVAAGPGLKNSKVVSKSLSTSYEITKLVKFSPKKEKKVSVTKPPH